MVSVTSESLDALPTSGTAFVWNNILSFAANIFGVDYTWDNGSAAYGANDGTLTGITSITALSLGGSVLNMHTGSGYPIFWTIDSVRQGNYVIGQSGEVPVPAPLVLLGLGLAAIGFTTKKRKI